MRTESAGVHEFFVLLMQEPAAFGQILQFTYALQNYKQLWNHPKTGAGACVHSEIKWDIE